MLICLGIPGGAHVVVYGRVRCKFCNGYGNNIYRSFWFTMVSRYPLGDTRQ